MKSTLFARPNLKLLLLGAVLLACVQHFITLGQSHETLLVAPVAVNAREVAPDQLRAMMREAEVHPKYRAYMRLSLHFEKAGDYRRALQYLRKAEKLESVEDGME
jgi:hypothetical protein